MSNYRYQQAMALALMDCAHVWRPGSLFGFRHSFDIRHLKFGILIPRATPELTPEYRESSRGL